MSASLPRFYTPEQVAAVIHRTPSHVRGLIRDGVLAAVDVSRPVAPRKDGAEGETSAEGEKRTPRPRWIIPEFELTAFLVARGLLAPNAIVETDAIRASVEAVARTGAVSESKR